MSFVKHKGGTNTNTYTLTYTCRLSIVFNLCCRMRFSLCRRIFIKSSSEKKNVKHQQQQQQCKQRKCERDAWPTIESAENSGNNKNNNNLKVKHTHTHIVKYICMNIYVYRYIHTQLSISKFAHATLIELPTSNTNTYLHVAETKMRHCAFNV